MKEKPLDFYKGMDISFLPEYLDEGMQTKDFDGTPTEPFELIQRYGVNAIRLRVWNNPENVPESKGYCSISHTIEMAKKIRKYGMSFLLDFHYSDYWADPAQQNKPKAWIGLSFDQLEEAVFTYTRDTLSALQREGALPDMVQIGNEIRSGLLFPDGELPDYEHMVRLVNAGIRGARVVADSDRLKVMIHLDQGGRYFYLQEWFSKALQSGLQDFDIIGLSYYPFWHGTFADLQETLRKLVQIYQKPVMIVETAYAWRKSEKGFIDETQERIAGFPATPEGQKKVLDLVMNIVAGMPDNKGLGVYYWEPLCVPRSGRGGWEENMGLLDECGKIMEGIRSFAFTRQQARPNEYAKIFTPAPLETLAGTEPELPEEVAVLKFDGTIDKKIAAWNLEALDKEWYTQPGIYKVTGQVENIQTNIEIEVNVVEDADTRENMLADVNWDMGLTQWTVEKSGEQVLAQLYPEFVEPFPAPPLNALRVESPKNFTFRISQQIMIPQDGEYCLQVEFMGTDTTNVDIRLFARNAEMEKETIIHPQEHVWTLYEIADIFCHKGRLTVGVSMTSPPIYGMMRRFRLYRKII